MGNTQQEACHPGEYLKDELEARGWTQKELAEMIDRPPRIINQIISGKAGITATTAHQLAAALGTSAEMWMNLQSQYELDKEQIDRDNIAARAQFRETFPFYTEIVKRGWIQKIADIHKRMQAMQALLGNMPNFAAKTRNELYNNHPPIQQVWIAHARQMAAAITLPTVFNANSKNTLLATLRPLLDRAEKIAIVPDILHAHGIRLIYSQALKGSKIDGACFWLDNNSPVIAMTLRMDRIDNYWFVLRHELEHVFNGDGKAETIVDEPETLNTETEGLPESEQLANAAAAEFCVPQRALDDYCVQHRGNLFAGDALETFAQQIQRHKGLIVGQLQHRTQKWTHQRRALEPVRAIILKSAPNCEGWDM